MQSTNSINLFDLTREELTAFFLDLGEKSFRADQLIKALHQQRKFDFTSMTNFSLELRRYLAEHAVIELPKIATKQISLDGTQKFLLELYDKKYIETVFIPEVDRGTLCISTQVGCALQCAFCATGKQGFQRNLHVSEIIGQLWLVLQDLNNSANEVSDNKCERNSATRCGAYRIITNVVLMGMGEPLLNFDNVVKALNLMCDDFAYGLSKYRVTLSTAGIIPAMQQLREVSNVSLAVSLHAPNNELRDLLVPINKKYPLEELIPVCRSYFTDRRRKVTFEYIMLEGVNDSRDHAKQLVRLLGNMPCKINLIPANFIIGTEFRPSSQEAIDKFRQVLLDHGFNTITRKTRGSDIAAACGQLAGSNI